MINNLTRRNVIKSLGAFGAAGALGSLARPSRADGNPIRLGLIAPLSGSQEVIGRYQLAGATIAVNQINQAGGVMGRPLELVTRDDKVAPAAGVAAAKDLSGNGVNLMLGVLSSGVALAISPTLQADNSVLVVSAASANELTHEQFSPNFFRTCDHAYSRQRALAKLVAEDSSDVADWMMISPQTAISQSNWDSFVDGMSEFYQAANKPLEIGDPIWTKYGATDYKNEIVQLMRSSAKGLYCGVYGGDAVTMFSQAAAYGLTKKFDVMVDPGSEFIIAQAMGKNTPEGLWSGFHWYYGAYEGHKINDDLYAAYVKETGDQHPAGYMGEAHASVLAYASAIQKAGSTDTEKVIAALEDLEFDTCKGMRKIRKEDHQAICDLNLVQFGPDDSEQGWKVTDYRVIKDDGLSEPAAPGQPIEFNFKKG
ncbi:ABC transporter substrate-binding protein [Hoeflea ulvae]|uniref:ABC transporter substrate-binding protein n=1 Tax=Hoeflea ulvae TaxID=2983764 RepID=A0ABT3YLU8_9HYPH|nr:ABC transporter substrate-binding protein [Hoeflea ulvae]MCY0096807.1 ABC transporter substrate-binding protein [Hoeflea ulvae]